MEWLHPVSLEQEVSIDVEVARVVTADFRSQLLLNVLLVQVGTDPLKLSVAEATARALLTDIVNVLTKSVDYTQYSGSRHT